MTNPTLRIVPLILGVCSLVLLSFSGCAHKKEYVPETDPNAPPPPAMQGYGEFFDGKLLVEASLGRGFRMRPGKMRDMDGRRGRGDSFTEVYYVDSDDEPEEQYFIPRMNNSTLPPVALRLRVTNQMAESVEVEFIECNSLLGNFAVRPEKITIAPGEMGAPEPMTSLLGLSAGEFQLKIGLKVGAIQESKILMLHTLKDARPPETEKGRRGKPPRQPKEN
ncbi:hypothetical protein M2447_001007 [Ereboglobus sp. PH5-10]|uniref:hypothetical protein n=1 Tax=Ereboglobus sp. PH5-10 TaxID=2940629 RepID=UPI0024055DAF|nr:hypothetical protein [Ereboglobus sp. PH5-10]MDF9826922.1 hypothetical protein [Ereboglobus sp. PH5-10]